MVGLWRIERRSPEQHSKQHSGRPEQVGELASHVANIRLGEIGNECNGLISETNLSPFRDSLHLLRSLITGGWFSESKSCIAMMPRPSADRSSTGISTSGREPSGGKPFAVCSTMFGWRNAALIAETPNQEAGGESQKRGRAEDTGLG
jgi:hypothetical protein